MSFSWPLYTHKSLRAGPDSEVSCENSDVVFALPVLTSSWLKGGSHDNRVSTVVYFVDFSHNSIALNIILVFTGDERSRTELKYGKIILLHTDAKTREQRLNTKPLSLIYPHQYKDVEMYDSLWQSVGFLVLSEIFINHKTDNWTTHSKLPAPYFTRALSLISPN